MVKRKRVLENESECLEFLHLTKRLQGSPDFPPSIIVDLYIVKLSLTLSQQFWKKGVSGFQKHRQLQNDDENEIKNDECERKFQKYLQISASTDGSPRSRVCANETICSAPHQH